MKRATKQQWEKIIKAQDASSRLIRCWYKEKNICISTFYKWRKQIKAEQIVIFLPVTLKKASTQSIESGISIKAGKFSLEIKNMDLENVLEVMVKTC